MPAEYGAPAETSPGAGAALLQKCPPSSSLRSCSLQSSISCWKLSSMWLDSSAPDQPLEPPVPLTFEMTTHPGMRSTASRLARALANA